MTQRSLVDDAPRDARPLPPFVARWLDGAKLRVWQARRSGDPACLRAARAALAELEQAVDQMTTEALK